MDKILVDVYVPAINKNYDIYIPFKSKFYEVTKLIVHMVCELSENYFIGQDDSIICDRKSGAIYNINMSSEQLGLKNGFKLMLI
ncbi:methyltransferase [Clostridium hydrogenum]|uniref:methyltransferase n=1 Tax=Clostridium hydrogenum TaxID=2855764 RepID=UPI001F41AC8B|nr:methyltransferase [Clostridium hydrogenum]